MKAYLIVVSAVAALGGFLFGFDTAVISGVNPFIRQYFDLNEILLGWANSSLILGAILGTQLAGFPSDRLGRKPTLMMTALLFLVSAVGSALSASFSEFVVYRLIGGIGVGAASVISPVYIAEISPAEHRGRLVSLNQFTIVTGILVAFFSNYLLEGLGANNWRWMLGVEGGPALFFLGAIFFLPESPRWLGVHGKWGKAIQAVSRWLDPDDVVREIGRIRSARSSRTPGTLSELLRPSFRKLTLIGVVLAVLQQFTGINIVMYYAPLIFERAGFATESALLQTVAVGGINFLFTLLAMRLVDRIGRRPLLLAGAFSMAFFLLALSVTFFAGKLGGYWILFFILGFIASFAASFGPVVWVLISEIFPNHLRGAAVSIATLALWGGNFAVTSSFPYLLSRWDGGVTFLFYACVNLVSLVFVALAIPETCGRSLEDLESALTSQDRAA